MTTMIPSRPLWLVDNASSGSHDAAALEELEADFTAAGLRVAYRTQFPRHDLPSPAMLDAAGISLLAIFAGDGTINSAIEQLAGWGGEVLVLPGGTMNLLYHRLHGEQSMAEVIAASAHGATRPTRPTMIRGPGCRAFAGLMAGPGTSWNDVREAMREGAMFDIAGQVVAALGETLGGAAIACADPPLGRREGYPLILLSPREREIEVVAYHAESSQEYLEQAAALLKRDFREGPHDALGAVPRVRLESADGKRFGILADGEPVATEGGSAEFTLAPCEVDVLATRGMP